MIASGVLLCALNALMRRVAMDLDAMQAQFLRYVFGVLALAPVILPSVLRHGWAPWRPRQLLGQIWRGAAHTAALSLYFLALPHLPFSDSTAINFTTPLWVMLGAALLLGERVSLGRWLAAVVGFAGMLVVVWPHWGQGSTSSGWSLVMLGSCPFFAASVLITKALTRHDSAEVIVTWQALTVMLFSMPFALYLWRAPEALHWGMLFACGILGSLAHYCTARAFALANVSAMQPVRFLDLVWASLFGWMLFSEGPTGSALAGGAVIVAATAWMARREARPARGA